MKVTNNNRLTQDHIRRIVEAFAEGKDIAHFSHLGTYEEIADNHYNLSFSTYVETEDTREEIDIVRLNAELAAKLTAELTAELTMRRKQYEYYRNHLRQCPAEKFEKMLMEETCYHISSGKNEDKRQEGDYPVYGSAGVIGRSLPVQIWKPVCRRKLRQGKSSTGSGGINC